MLSPRTPPALCSSPNAGASPAPATRSSTASSSAARRSTSGSAAAASTHIELAGHDIGDQAGAVFAEKVDFALQSGPDSPRPRLRRSTCFNALDNIARCSPDKEGTAKDNRSLQVRPSPRSCVCMAPTRRIAEKVLFIASWGPERAHSQQGSEASTRVHRKFQEVSNVNPYLDTGESRSTAPSRFLVVPP